MAFVDKAILLQTYLEQKHQLSENVLILVNKDLECDRDLLSILNIRDHKSFETTARKNPTGLSIFDLSNHQVEWLKIHLHKQLQDREFMISHILIQSNQLASLANQKLRNPEWFEAFTHIAKHFSK